MTTTTVNFVTLGSFTILRGELMTLIGFLEMNFQNFAADSLPHLVNGLMRSTTKLLPEERQLCDVQIAKLEKALCDIVALRDTLLWEQAKDQIKLRLEEEIAPALDEIIKSFGGT